MVLYSGPWTSSSKTILHYIFTNPQPKSALKRDATEVLCVCEMRIANNSLNLFIYFGRIMQIHVWSSLLYFYGDNNFSD